MELHGLEELNLSYSPVTDDATRDLAGLDRLRRLWLRGTALTDAGLAHLRELPKLEYLDVSRTAVGPEGVARLQAAIPRLQVRM
jgi:hypothetical protein